MDRNEQIFLTLKDTESILKELNLILISLHNMGTYYYGKSKQAYEVETTDFVDKNAITARLAYIRRIIPEVYYSNISKEQYDEYCSDMEKLNYWEKPGDFLPYFEER